jgi:hypothetical protein
MTKIQQPFFHDANEIMFNIMLNANITKDNPPEERTRSVFG